MIDFAYSGLNLRFNPFGELDRQQRLENAIPRCDLDALQNFLGDPCQPDHDRSAIQFIGKPGSGKSTHMLMLAARLSDFQYIHIPVNCRRAVPEEPALMIDEAQRLTWRQRHRLLRRAQRLILATHRCFDRQLRSCGFSVRTVSLDENPTVEWLSMAFQRRIQFARRPGHGCPPRVSDETVVKLLAEFGNNIRGMERQLFETFRQLNSDVKSCMATQ